MPRTPAVTKTPTSIDVQMGIVFFFRRGSFRTERLPQLPAAALGEYNVCPVTFDQDSISFTQKARGNSCVVRLMKGDFTLERLRIGNPCMSHDTDSDIIVADISCLKEPKCELIPSKRKNGMLETQKIPLAKIASQMESIRIELNDIPCYWKVRGATKGKTLAELKHQLDIICAGIYISSTALRNMPDREDEDPFEEDQKPTSEIVAATTDSQPRPASRNNQLSTPPHPKNRPLPAK
ncbi:MAG: hypothetical protein Q9180_009943, partial [Flavoplaca navasiana]